MNWLLKASTDYFIIASGYFQDLELATAFRRGPDGGDSNTLLSNTLPDAEGPYPAVVTSASRSGAERPGVGP
jgi:hypothetical protein